MTGFKQKTQPDAIGPKVRSAHINTECYVPPIIPYHEKKVYNLIEVLVFLEKVIVILKSFREKNS